jgi:Leucine-rich repeat (LRR) protein
MNKPYTLLYRLLLLVVLAAFFGQTHAQVSAGDSLSLVAFYHSTGGAAWTDNTGWLTGNVSGWYGVTVRGGHVTRLSLPSDNLTGPVPASLANLDSLVYLDLSGNDLTSFPSLSGRHLDTLDLAGNALTFKDLVPNRAVADSFYYSPQDSVDVFEDTTVV